jgi:hypothetical protein
LHYAASARADFSQFDGPADGKSAFMQRTLGRALSVAKSGRGQEYAFK